MQGNLKTTYPETYKVLEEALKWLSTTVKGKIPDTRLKDNIGFKIEINSDSYEVNFLAPEYWKYVEYGRNPGKQPPVSAIANWITIKRIVPRAYNNKVPTQQGLAFVIARSIGRKGTKGWHFLSSTLSEFESEFKEKIETAITTDISNSLDNSLKPIGGYDNTNQTLDII